jgi:hypothetical protein
VVKYNEILIWQGRSPRSISDRIDDELKIPNVSLILIKSSMRSKNLKIVGPKILGSHGQIDKLKIGILNIDSILN